MESIRAQLAETQGALTARDKKFRQLRAEQKLLLEEKSTLEARVARLESENLRLKGKSPTTTGESSKPAASARHKTKDSEISLTHKSTGNLLALDDQQHIDGDETVTMSRSRMKKAEAQFEQMADEVAEKTKLCESLKARLAQSSPIPVLELSDEQVMARWNNLREQIRFLSLERLNKTFEPDSVPDRYKDEFKILSPHWKTYASTDNITCYLFRALIWRYIIRYFSIFCRAFGRDISRKVGDVAAALATRVSDVDFEEWRIRTATLVDMVYSIDAGLIDEMTTKILDVITPLVKDANTIALRSSLRDIVKATAELSAVFDRSRFVVLMYNEPGDSQTHGFPYAEGWMEMRAKVGAQGTVDLMITPSLLKKEAEYSILVKAEVVC
ncbi:hypothetical protein GQX73_g10579 [Xylaria multiplex]|uniref:Uncharacterized protein n=1 Tax=Xylaria multiplex TaxID=323545 RepID=A0A7C8MMB1_9PEZI|nr:hypothetical protein GQX73_g10579 [Xylaria multiplex]